VSPETVDRKGNANLIDAAAAAHADLILISTVGAAPDHPMELMRAKHAAEQHLMASGVEWTIVRSTAFIELWAEIMRRGIVFGRGENPINFVSVNEVAAAVELLGPFSRRARAAIVMDTTDMTFQPGIGDQLGHGPYANVVGAARSP
jgi:uncharacterized protein YbjT (DUF2867 family)